MWYCDTCINNVNLLHQRLNWNSWLKSWETVSTLAAGSQMWLPGPSSLGQTWCYMASLAPHATKTTPHTAMAANTGERIDCICIETSKNHTNMPAKSSMIKVSQMHEYVQELLLRIHCRLKLLVGLILIPGHSHIKTSRLHWSKPSKTLAFDCQSSNTI